MRIDILSAGRCNVEPATSGELHTGPAPSFRAPLDTPAVAGPGPGPASGAFPVVPGYEVVAELGRGGMGVVYRARQTSLNRWVALKLVHAGAAGDPAVRARFRTEAEAVARLQHPHVVQVFEVGEQDGCPFLALEYLAGGSLDSWADSGVRPERDGARLVESLARAVQHAHEHGILHRDLKPSNVLLTDDGTPKVTDFGLAKVVDRSDGPTRTAAVIGTPSYMAPEQAAGETGRVGVSADVYALGALLYELLTGRAPFRGSSPLDTLEQVRTRAPVPPRRVRGQVSPDLETICLRCLEKAPSARYAAAAALADDLARFLAGEPIRARPVPAWRRLGRAVRRRPTLVARAACVAALVCVLLAGGWYVRMSDRLAAQRAEERYEKFAGLRDEALYYGLIAPDEGAVFRGGESAADQRVAEAAARAALGVAGVDPKSAAPAVDGSFALHRRPQVAADCYTLLLVLADAQSQPPAADGSGTDRRQEALRLLDCAAKLASETRALHGRRAVVLEGLGRSEEARAERERSGAVPPEGALDQFLTGEELYRRGEWAGARTAFHRVLAAQPGHLWAQFFVAICQLKAREWDAARAGLSACLDGHPNFVWAYLFRGFADEKLGATAAAEGDWRRALALNPNEDARHALLLTRGVFRFGQGDLDGAAADFRSAAALKPDQYSAYFNLAHVHLARGEYEAAAEEAYRGLRFRPPVETVFGYHAQRARSLLRDGRHDEAVRACAEALRFGPGRHQPLEVRGRAQLALGLPESAERSFDEYLANGGDLVPDVFRARGRARMGLGKYPEAAEDYTRALELAPTADLYQHRGWAHFFCDAWKLALRDFARAIELDPQAGDAYTGRGLARVMLGDVPGAVADAEAAVSRRPDTPEMMHNIACIFSQAAARAERETAGLVKDYRRRALESVRQALRLVPPADRPAFWRDKVLPDAALDPIRGDPAFEQLPGEADGPVPGTAFRARPLSGVLP